MLLTCRHDGPYWLASNGELQGWAACGGLKRSGILANGTPRYLLTRLEEPGSDVCTPVITPDSMVTVGPFPSDIGAAELRRRRLKPKTTAKSDDDIPAGKRASDSNGLNSHTRFSTSLYSSIRTS